MFNNQMLAKALKKNKSLITTVAIMVATLFLAISLGIITHFLIKSLTLNRGAYVSPDGPQIMPGEPTVEPGQEVINITPNPLAPEFAPTLTPWDGAGRVTVLLLGLDYRDWSAGSDYSRSDTMILMTLDPLAHSAGILSIPRDLWVNIPGFKHGKINTAYYLGDAYKLPGGGPGLAVKTVEQFLGIPINYYAQIDFSAFVKFIDEIGGVKIDVPETITIDLLGSGSATKKTLQPGLQVLPGEWALAYARARYTHGGDFDRAQRQQQVILGIRDRMLRLDMLPTLIGKANTLYQQLASGINTNLSLDQAIKLALLANQVPTESITRGVIDEGYVLFGRSPDNLSILIPLIDKIHVLRDEIFATSGALNPLTPGTALERMLAEQARISVQNKSQAEGLASRTANYLVSLGFNVAEERDVDGLVSATTLIDHSGRPYTTRYLVDQLGLENIRVVMEYDPANPVDLEIILGVDWARNNKLP